MDYFEISDNFESKRAWFLGIPKCKDGIEPDVWAFTSGQMLSFDSELVVPVQQAGDIVDITFSHYSIPYVRPRIGRVFEAFASWDTQRIPAWVENGEQIEILNVLTMLDCFDRRRSNATYKEEGKPNMVIELRIDPKKAEGHHVLRVKHWRGPLIVSELILEQLRRIGATGFVVKKVS